MTIPRPTTDQITEAAGRQGYHLTADEVGAFQRMAAATLDSYDRIDALYDTTVTVPEVDRPVGKAAPEDDPHGAWAATTVIPPTGRGPLDGKTIAIKDNVSVAGLPLMNGSYSLEGFVAQEDATVVTRLLAAGGTIVGKSVCEDLCLSGASFTSKPAPVTNPWDPTRSAGGSSSGSAVLLATGQVDIAIGCDQGGSIRMPSAWSGVVGHKPTHTLVPYTGAFPIERTIDHIGPMARSVTDVAVTLGVIAGRDGLDPRQLDGHAPQDYVGSLGLGVEGLRIGLLREGFGIPGVSDPGVDETVRQAVEALREAGATVGEVSVPWHRDVALDLWNVIATDGATYQMLNGSGYGLNVDGYYDPAIMEYFGRQRFEQADRLADTVRSLAVTGEYTLRTTGGAVYARARRLVPYLIDAYDRALTTYDVLVLPTIPFLPAPLVDPSAEPEEYAGKALDMVGNTAPFDISGHPATSVPAGLSDGLPVGMMIVAPRFDDALGLRVAAAWERIRGEFPSPLTAPAHA